MRQIEIARSLYILDARCLLRVGRRFARLPVSMVYQVSKKEYNTAEIIKGRAVSDLL